MTFASQRVVTRIIHRLRQEFAIRRDGRCIRPSPLFDPVWYRAHNPDVESARIDPLRHYLLCGAREGRDPGPGFSTSQYLARNPDVATAGLNPLAHYVAFGAAEGRSGLREASGGAADALGVREPPSDAAVPRQTGYMMSELAPLRVFHGSSPGQPRLTVLTDSLGAESLFGGVATAILLGVLAAERTGRRLRIVTETGRADPTVVGALLKANGLTWNEEIEFGFTDSAGLKCVPIELGSHDVLLTTSWWGTNKALRVVPAQQVIYLVQEDERMFHPLGDQHLLARETTGRADLRFIVNSRLLFDHLIADGCIGARDRAAWFEPAFSAESYYMEPRRPRLRTVRRCMFYARPNHARNLFHRGCAALNAALEAGILDPREWEFWFVGRDVGPLELSGGVRPRIAEGLAWHEYAALVRSMDLGLSLMYTPHPGYPSLDLAASGAVAVTNSFAGKTSLSRYSDNIICVDPGLDSLVGGLRAGAALAGDWVRRTRHYEDSRLNRDWRRATRDALAAVLPQREPVGCS